MLRRTTSALLCLASALLAPDATAEAARVDARDHEAFWLWAGVRPQPAMAKARHIYLLYGAVGSGPSAQLVAQRPATPQVRHADLWLVVRAETLEWTPQTHRQLLAALGRWQAAGNRLVGVQIDFDARTRHLERYAAFLRDLRRRLPPRYRLGITGLLDWSANGDPKGLDALAGTVDELVLQIYQGRKVIPGNAAYMLRLKRLKVPFRIGLLQGGEWQAPPGLTANPNFRGYVVFLLNPT